LGIRFPLKVTPHKARLIVFSAYLDLLLWRTYPIRPMLQAWALTGH
jgi:hypothetical protein